MSASLLWNDDYCIGHEIIDSEHKRLFEIAGRIFAVKNPLMDIAAIKNMVHQLYDYMQEHFEHEETCMIQAVYSDSGTHKEKHAEIIREMNDIVKLSKNFIQIQNRLVVLMRKWLLDHVLKEDLKVKKAIDIHEADNAEPANRKQTL
jgi:hemerythrin